MSITHKAKSGALLTGTEYEAADAHEGTLAHGDLDSVGTDDHHAQDHDHDGDPTQKLAQANTHESPDTDSGTSSLHHTLGTGANQAAAGNHTHSGGGTPQWKVPVQEKATSWGGNTMTMDATPTNGNLLILLSFAEATENITGITQTNVTWTKLAESTASTAPHVEIWKGVVAASAGTGITVTYSSGSWRASVVSEWAGLTGTLDQSSVVTAVSNTSLRYAPTITPTNANALVVTVMGTNSNSHQFTTMGSAQMMRFHVAHSLNFPTFFGFPGQTPAALWSRNANGTLISMLTASIT